MNSLQSLIYKTLGTSNKHTVERLLTRKLSRNNPNKAHRHVLTLLNGEIPKPFLVELLAEKLELPLSEVELAAEEARQQIQTEQYKKLWESRGPHLEAITSGPIRQITFAAMCHEALLVIRLPKDISAQSLDRQKAIIRDAINGHIAERGTTLPIFGAIEYFNYHPNTEITYKFDLSGRFSGDVSANVQYGPYAITIGRKTFVGAEVSSIFKQ